MLRAALVSIVAACAACARQKPRPPSIAPSTTSAVPNAAPIEAVMEEPIVRDGMRSRSLAGAAPSFAAYLNAMHARIHPEFADKELDKLDALPADDPLNDKDLSTRLEIVLRAEDGHVVKVGVIKTSSVTAFDTASLESVQRAQPFGAAPRAIASADGNVYVEWEFRRDEVFACSPRLSRPFLFGP